MCLYYKVKYVSHFESWLTFYHLWVPIHVMILYLTTHFKLKIRHLNWSSLCRMYVSQNYFVIFNYNLVWVFFKNISDFHYIWTFWRLFRLIATPGRFLHLLVEMDMKKLASVEYVVFDEADRWEMYVCITVT